MAEPPDPIRPGKSKSRGPDAEPIRPIDLDGDDGPAPINLDGYEDTAPARPGKAPSREAAPPPPAPLPRLWRTGPDPDEEDPAESSAALRKKAKGADAAGGSASAPEPRKKPKKADTPPPPEKRADGTTKIEETPKYDTYEARQRVRWIIGSVMASIFVLTLILVIRRFRGSEPVVETTGPDPRTTLALQARQKDEQEAQSLLDTARSAAENGRTDAAVDLFNKLAKSYPNTPAAREAMAALDRHRRKLPILGPTPDPPTGPQPPPPGTSVAATPPAQPQPGTAVTVEPLGPKPPPTPVVATTPAGVVSTPTAPVIPIKPLPPGFKAKPGAPIHETGWPTEIIASRDGAEMVFIPGGTFTMGRDDGEPAERPAHQVRLAAYYIDRHEVTNRQYAQFVKETGRPEPPRAAAPSRETPDPPTSTEELPVTNISARDAKAYCLWAGKTLPTEAQWERAARGEDGRIFPWGNDPPTGAAARPWRSIEAVKAQPRDVSPFGVHDLAGNAWEWTGDLYDARYYQQFRDTLARDPLGPPATRARPILVTVKGSSKDGRVFSREGLKVDQRFPYLGFRGALQAEKPEPPPAAPVNPGSGSNNLDPTGGAGVVPF